MVNVEVLFSVLLLDMLILFMFSCELMCLVSRLLLVEFSVCVVEFIIEFLLFFIFDNGLLVIR